VQIWPTRVLPTLTIESKRINKWFSKKNTAVIRRVQQFAKKRRDSEKLLCEKHRAWQDGSEARREIHRVLKLNAIEMTLRSCLLIGEVPVLIPSGRKLQPPRATPLHTVRKQERRRNSLWKHSKNDLAKAEITKSRRLKVDNFIFETF
jgi:hypothetical protein